MVWKRAVKMEYEKESLLAYDLVCSTNLEQKMGEESVLKKVERRVSLWDSKLVSMKQLVR